MEEIKIGRSTFALRKVAAGGQTMLVIPGPHAEDGDGITFYRPNSEGWVHFKIGPGGRRKVWHTSPTGKAWMAAVPMPVGRRLALSPGTHEIEVVAGDEEGTLKFKVDK